MGEKGVERRKIELEKTGFGFCQGLLEALRNIMERNTYQNKLKT